MRREFYHEVKILNKYYEIDEENYIITIPLKYERASDIIDLNVTTKSNYAIKEDVMADIVDKIKKIPPAFKIKLKLLIDDFEGYDYNELLASINDFLELNHYAIIREKKVSFIRAIILLAIGISILVFNAFGNKNNWFSNSYNIVTDVVNIVAWVFVWQATTVAFLTPSQYRVNSNRFKLRVISIAIYNKDNELLVEEMTIEKFNKWVGNKKHERFERICLLFSGGALLVSATISLISGISNIPMAFTSAEGVDIFIFILIPVAEIITGAVELLIGVSALSLFYGRGPFRKKSRFVFLPLMVIILALEIAIIISGISILTEIFSVIVSVLAAVAYIVGVILSFISSHRLKKEMNN